MYEELICSLDFGGNITIRDASVEATNKMYKKFYGILSAERRRAEEIERERLTILGAFEKSNENCRALESRLQEAEKKAESLRKWKSYVLECVENYGSYKP